MFGRRGFYFILLLFTVSVQATEPNPALTPGAKNLHLTKAVICSSVFRTADYRTVTDKTKKNVFERYGIPWEKRNNYEVDHLIPLEIGGSNLITNLWPQPYLPRPGAHEKDVIENRLHKEMCAGALTLEEAQTEIIQNWKEIYLRHSKP